MEAFLYPRLEWFKEDSSDNRSKSLPFRCNSMMHWYDFQIEQTNLIRRFLFTFITDVAMSGLVLMWVEDPPKRLSKAPQEMFSAERVYINGHYTSFL